MTILCCVKYLVTHSISVSGPIHGGWSAWTESSLCQMDCIYLKRSTFTMTRECNNPDPQFGGDTCLGDATKQETATPALCGIASWKNYQSHWEIYMNFAIQIQGQLKRSPCGLFLSTRFRPTVMVLPWSATALTRI